MGFRLGVDTGGTFTDLLLLDEASGRTYTAKVPTAALRNSIKAKREPALFNLGGTIEEFKARAAEATHLPASQSPTFARQAG